MTGRNVFDAGALDTAADLIGDGYPLLSTARALAAAPQLRIAPPTW
jgi:hypothetical protein